MMKNFPFLGSFVSPDDESTNKEITLGGLVTEPIEKYDPFSILSKSESSQKIEHGSWFIVESKKYVTPTITPLSLSLTVQSNSLEAVIVNKLENISKVQKIYIRDLDTLISVRVLLEMETYDYELMDKILNEAEFPIKDMFSTKLFDFEYIPYEQGSDDNLIETFNQKLIFDRGVNNLLSTFHVSYTFEDPIEKIPQVEVFIGKTPQVKFFI